jgi:hypothetical protein
MRLQWGIGVLLIAAFGAPAARADVYQINFAGDPPNLLPTAGSFNYDPTAQTFTAFLVTWDSFVFDMTNFANAPSGYAEFEILSGTNGDSCLPATPCDQSELFDLFSIPSCCATENSGAGGWTITKESGPTPTPEPSPLGTAALGLLSLVFARVTQKSHRRRT